MLIRLVCLALGMVFGSIPTGYIVARLHGQDIRKMGSGNIGSTNALRSLGKKAGAMTLTGDILKGLIPLFITAALFGGAEDMRYLITMYTGLGAVLGHDFSPWMGFKGGKGIATSGALVLFIDPKFFVLVLVALVAIAVCSGYVSLGSLSVAVVFIIINFYFIFSANTFGWSVYPQFAAVPYKAELAVITLILAGLAIVRHKANIQRLMNGTENKFSSKKK